GGSAVLSEGFVWTARDVETFSELVPDGDPEHGRRLVGGHSEVVDWIRSTGVDVASQSQHAIGLGGGFKVDVIALMARCVRMIEDAEDAIIREADVLRLLMGDDAVVGVELRDRDGRHEINARAVVLATGGFAASTTLRERYMGSGAGDMLLRSNPTSAGGGL